MSGVDPGTVFTAIGTVATVVTIGGGARSYLKKARAAEIADAVKKALHEQDQENQIRAQENRIRALEGRSLDDDA